MSLRLPFFLLLLALFATAALADTPASITEDYHRQADAALVKLNDTLEKATTPLIAALIKAGDTAGADQLTTQLKSKTTGEPVPKPQASATLLFAQYDQARMKALEPVQKAAIARIDAMLSGKEGKDLDTVTALGKVRGEIEAGKVEPVDDTAYLAKQGIRKVWGYYLTDKYKERFGTLRLNEDGTMVIEAANPVKGTWRKTPDPKILAVSIINATYVHEDTEIILVNSREATMKRGSGMKYLKAD